MRVWDKFLTEQDKSVFAQSGHGKRGGFGARPALLVVDMSYAFCGDKDEPITESVKRWRNSCGSVAWKSFPVISKVLAAARAKAVPVIYTTGAVATQRDWGSWAMKNSRTSDSLLQNGLDGYEIMPQIKPEPDEIVLRKMKPSAFYGTPLLSYLHQSQIDTLLVAGTTTSGCVRATVVDGFSLNYRMTVIEDCVFDRFESSHAMNLFDMHAKYADVVDSNAAVSYFGGISDDVFGAGKLTAAE